MQMQNKKGQVSALTGSILAVTMAIIVFVFGLTVLSQLQTTQTAGSLVYNETGTAITGFTGLNDYWGLIVLAVVIGVVFGLIFWAFGGKKMK